MFASYPDSSTSISKIHHYTVWAPDYIDEGHFRYQYIVSRTIRISRSSCGLLTSEWQDTESWQKIVGSVLICEAGSLEDVRSLVEAHLYWKEGDVTYK
ncbi:hypothetical protein BD769DRAFT_1429309 [Suillus cothurnatus]|jgi:hypothetical protein|nr:hypothetical protein BD769DRAFT_1429309 [Suillus cothurnatus]